MRLAAVLAGVLVLSGCDTPLGTEVARDQAKVTVNRVVAKKAPGIDATPVTDCIIDNATGSEIVKIAAESVTGTVSTETTQLVLEIATRTETVKCLVNNVGPIVVAKIITAS